MNEYQKNLWDDLMALVDESEAFYYADQEIGGVWYRIFNYRLASYTEFCKPSALECRGHMFAITEEGKDAEMCRLAALPMEKFFNINENPFTMGLDLSTLVTVQDKADGSLISTFVHIDASGDSHLALKTKGSLHSDQAQDATKWLASPENSQFAHELMHLTVLGYTVNMEWVAPHNRIVIGYEEPNLRVLNIRNTIDGSYFTDLHDNFVEIYAHMIHEEIPNDNEMFVNAIPNMQDIEGYVARFASGQRVKIKTAWYLALHKTKDNINSPRRLFEAVLEEATDDMKTLFVDDPLAIKTIEDMEAFVQEKYNHMVDTVERFYERNKHLERKEYAILGQEELKDTMFFGLAMSKYLDKPFSYKDFLKSKWKQLGLKDLENDDE